MADSDGRLFVYSIIGFFVGIYLFFKGFIWLKQKRLIENTPTSKIRSIAMGLVEIYGSAILIKNKVLKSPLTNNDCVYYKYTVEEYRKSGKNSYWATIKSGNESTLFYLQDDTGKVLVEPKQAEIDIPLDFTFETGWGKTLPAGLNNFMKTSNFSATGIFGIGKKLRFREYYIAPKDKLYIMGTADRNPHLKAGTAVKNEDAIMIQKGKNVSFYYISDTHEKNVLTKMKWKTIGGLWGGGALIVGCLTVIFLYLGLI